MNVRAEILDSFQIFGPKLSTDIIDKCEEICITYNISAEDLANEWAAYSVTNLNGDQPTVDGLSNMEKKEFMRKTKDGLTTKKASGTPTPVRVYKSNKQEIDSDAIIIDSYSTPKSNRKSIKRPRSPDENCNKQPKDGTPKLVFSPASYSPSIDLQSRDYTSRMDSGNSVLSYGLQDLLHTATFKRGADDAETNVSIEMWLEKDRQLSADTRYMYEVMNSKAASLNNTTEWLGKHLINKYKLEEPQSFGTKTSSGNTTTYGRICCDADGKLNDASVLLESSQQLGKGATVHLNMNKLNSYAVFPGQVVAMQGFNINGHTFIAQQLYTDASPSLPSPSEHPVKFKEPLQMMVATGPFTLRDNLQYQPLQDLMKHVRTNIPHVLILIGPFVDATHEKIRDTTMAETFSEFFENLIDCVMTPLEGLNVQVVLVASQKDAHHHVIYPTPPYVLRKKYPNLHCVPDPSLLNIDGLVVGVTSVDVLLHLGKEEICSSTFSGDRMSRLVSHLFNQQSFYPIYPPDDEISVDHELLGQYGVLDVIPHVFILPSNLRYFIKHIKGSVVINPERLAKGYVGGTFSRIQVFPPEEGGFINNNVVAQIIRV